MKVALESSLTTVARRGAETLRDSDPELWGLLEKELNRQRNTLALVASSSIADPSVLACESAVAVNVTAEGYPGRRFHAGCEFVDGIEQLAIERAKSAFGAQYANVQPHCASSANEIVMFGLMKPGDTILGMELQYGGHLTHGAKTSLSGQCFHAVGYGLNSEGFIDYDQVFQQAHQFRPKLIICGATAYPRMIDFQRFREIADQVDAYLLADITHTAGLVIAGLHPNPIDSAHFTTTCTHKQLYGPRGGLILMGKDSSNPAPGGIRTLSEMIQNAVFPMFQGAPAMNAIAAKARALSRAATHEFAVLAGRILADGRALARELVNRGYPVITGGSDSHIVLVDVGSCGLTGVIASRALEETGIIVNKNKIPGDTRTATVTSGIRLGTNSVALRGMGPAEMEICADLVDRVLTAVHTRGECDYTLPDSVRKSISFDVREICAKYPIPSYAAMI